MAAAPVPVADGVWIVRGGLPRRGMNVYLLADAGGETDAGGGVIAFDAGIRGMGAAVRRLARSLGGLRRVVLSHAHPDHRGGAPGMGVPVVCHEAERFDVEGGGGVRYFTYSELPTPLARRQMPVVMRLVDSGPLPVAATLCEGDVVAGFEVIHLPGHAPGLIALWRERDRLALCSDCVYTTGGHGPEVPKVAYNQDTLAARRSARKLAGLTPAAAWPGHAGPVLGDVAGQLVRASEAPVYGDPSHP